MLSVSTESLLERKILNNLYPDTTYQYESGGDPVAIPDLTQEMFIAPTVMTVRSEGTEMANDGLNYDNSGFYLSLPSEFINSDTAMYNVFLLLNVNQEPVLIDLEQVITVTKGGVIG